MAWESIIVTKLRRRENTNHSLSEHRQASVKGERKAKKLSPLSKFPEWLDSQTEQSLAEITDKSYCFSWFLLSDNEKIELTCKEWVGVRSEKTCRSSVD